MPTREEYIETIRAENRGEPPPYPWPNSSSISFEPVPCAPDVEVSFEKTPVDEAVQAVKEAQDAVGKEIWEGMDEV